MSGATRAVEVIAEDGEALAEAVVAREFDRHPELAARWGPAARGKCREDVARHLDYLRAAIERGSPALFEDYVAWAKILLEGLGLGATDLVRNLRYVRDILAETIDPDAAEVTTSYIDAGLRRLPEVPSELPSFVADDAPHGALARRYLERLLEGDRRSASELIRGAVERDGIPVRDVYLRVFQPVQWELGRLWQTSAISVAQEHFCTGVTQMIMSQLYPRIFSDAPTGRTLVAACVGGDLHEIGLRMLADLFEMDGWDTYYLGANTPVRAIVGAATERRATLLALSCTMTFHLPRLREVIAAVRAEPTLAEVKILVGGYPFRVDSELWRSVGADGFAADAESAVAVADRLLADGVNGGG